MRRLKRFTVIAVTFAMLAGVVAVDSRADDKRAARILFVTQSAGFRHGSVTRKDDQLSVSERIMTELGISSNLFRVDCTQDVTKDFTIEKLENYDIVMFYTTGKLPIEEKTLDYFENKTQSLNLNSNLSNKSIGELYGLALISIELGLLDKAENILEKLIQQNSDYAHFHIAYMDLLIAKDQTNKGINYIKERLSLSPRNVPLTLAYAETELNYGNPKTSHEILLDLFNTIPPSPSQIRLIANSANQAGDFADSFSYMAEYYLSIGSFEQAREQLKVALSFDSLSKIQTAKFIARLNEIEEYIDEMNRQRR